MTKRIQLQALLFITGMITVIFGCKDNEPATEPNTSARTYVAHVQPLMTNYCITCHSGSSASADLVLSSYQEVKSAVETGGVLSRLNDTKNPMPPSGNLSSDNIDIIQGWIDNNYAKE